MRFLMTVLALFLAPAVYAQTSCTEGQNYVPVPFAKEEITVSTTAVGLTAATYKPTGSGAAVMAFITIDTDTLRFWLDGSIPTSTVGHAAANPSSLVLCEASLPRALFIRSGAADAKLRVTYFRRPS
jgi:hypothetical protein